MRDAHRTPERLSIAPLPPVPPKHTCVVVTFKSSTRFPSRLRPQWNLWVTLI